MKSTFDGFGGRFLDHKTVTFGPLDAPKIDSFLRIALKKSLLHNQSFIHYSLDAVKQLILFMISIKFAIEPFFFICIILNGLIVAIV